jgi:hypothetical protein
MKTQTKIFLIIGLLIALILSVLKWQFEALETVFYIYISIFYFGTIAVWLVYQYIQEHKNREAQKKADVERINSKEPVVYCNFLIQRSLFEGNLIHVQNELFWLDEEASKKGDKNELLDVMIDDFKRICKKNKYLTDYLTGKIIEFSLVDNVNFDNKELCKKRIILSESY